MTDIALRPTMGMVPSRTVADASPAVAGQSFLARIGEAFMRAQRRRVEREIARLLRQNGGLMNDDLERTISRQFGI
jgi:hypothetical protein